MTKLLEAIGTQLVDGMQRALAAIDLWSIADDTRGLDGVAHAQAMCEQWLQHCQRLTEQVKENMNSLGSFF